MVPLGLVRQYCTTVLVVRVATGRINPSGLMSPRGLDYRELVKERRRTVVSRRPPKNCIHMDTAARCSVVVTTRCLPQLRLAAHHSPLRPFACNGWLRCDSGKRARALRPKLRLALSLTWQLLVSASCFQLTTSGRISPSSFTSLTSEAAVLQSCAPYQMLTPPSPPLN